MIEAQYVNVLRGRKKGGEDNMDAISRLIILTCDMEENSVYRYVGTTILQNIRALPKLSIYELAEICAASPSTISRFVKLTGFSSFAAFKLEIAMELLPENQTEEEEEESSPLENQTAYLAACADTLGALRELLTPELLGELAQHLRQAQGIYFLLSENLHIRRLQRRLFIDGKRTQMQGRPNQMETLVPQMRAGDMLFLKAISPWETESKMKVACAARARGVCTVAVSPDDNTACAAADYWLHFPHVQPGLILMAEQIVFSEITHAYAQLT